MKKLLILAVLVMASGVVVAQDNSVGYDAGLTGSIDLTYQSRYIWRGFDVFSDNDPAAQLTANLNFFDTGFGMNVVGHRAIGSGHENDERWDYNFYYGNVLFAEDVMQTNFRIGFVHYNYAELPQKFKDLEEVHAIVSMPNLTGVAGLVPSYACIKMYPANSGSTGVGHNASGFLHQFMMDYTFAVPGVTPDVPEQIFKLHSELVYNDGVSPFNTNVDQDWSHAVVGISTDVDLGYGFAITPGVYYQYSMERTVNVEDETWVTVGGRYSF
ncbi:MAG: hypothetical protein K9N55_02455 [Phycisphaerae bacterium]|nr:hypothetical protein [Phycisphaerae bacterium]